MTDRLNLTSLSRLPANIRRPAYDPALLPIGLAHIGVGAFHRCHQAEYTDDMLEQGFGAWGVVGVNIRPPQLRQSLGPQDGLFTRTLRKGKSSETRVIGCLRRVIDIEDAASGHAAIAALAAPEVQAITLTLTEKGYCHTPASGTLDGSNAGIVADRALPAQPRTALGLLAAVCQLRMQQDAGPLTVMSCDNLPANGRLLRRVFTEFMSDRSAELQRWIERNAAFPCTMVDRIVPATAAEDLDWVATRIGMTDAAAVVGEPFRQWVIEDQFAGVTPPWHRAGAQLVSGVEAYELVKMRILNAAQSTLSHLGPFLGHEFSHQAAADPLLARLVHRMLSTESARTLPNLAAMPVAPYIETTFERIANTAINHRCHQIGTDGSQKIVQRLLNPLRQLAEQGHSAPLLTLAVAAWIAYVLAGARTFGRLWSPSDPYAFELIALAEKRGADFEGLARDVTGTTAIFGAPPSLQNWHADIARHLAGILSLGRRDYLASVVGP